MYVVKIVVGCTLKKNAPKHLMRAEEKSTSACYHAKVIHEPRHFPFNHPVPFSW